MTHRVTSRALQTRLVLPLLALIGTASVAGCGDNFTNAIGNATRNVATADLGPLAIRGARLVMSPEASTPSPSTSPAVSPAGEPTPPPSPSVEAYLMLTIVNSGSGAESLTGASVAGATVAPGSGTDSLTIEPRKALQFGDPDLGYDGPALEVSGFSEPPKAGTSVEVTLSFDNHGTVRLAVPVKDIAAAGTTSTAEPVPLSTGQPLDTGSPEPGFPPPTVPPTATPTGSPTE